MKLFFVAAMSAALFISACAGAPATTVPASGAGTTTSSGNLTISGAWARPALATKMDGITQTAGHSMDGPVSGAYMVIENTGAADKLISVSTAAAEAAEIHQTQESNGMMMMVPMPDGLDIPANGKVEIKPGGYHIMLMNIKQDLNPGANITLTRKFQSGQEIVMAVPVRENQ